RAAVGDDRDHGRDRGEGERERRRPAGWVSGSREEQEPEEREERERERNVRSDIRQRGAQAGRAHDAGRDQPERHADERAAGHPRGRAYPAAVAIRRPRRPSTKVAIAVAWVARATTRTTRTMLAASETVVASRTTSATTATANRMPTRISPRPTKYAIHRLSS